tara:strand:+ start:344 stop:490 length:147 start_codon:yes stop_codon:yes gene_type:complete
MQALEDLNQSFIKVSYVSSNLDPTTHLTSYNSILAFLLYQQLQPNKEN